MKKLLIVVDMQNDFLTGSLANPEAVRILPNVRREIENADFLIFTRDTHDENYLNTQEGKNLPVPHCIKNTAGWEIVPELVECAKRKCPNYHVIDKPTFGWNGWFDFFTEDGILSDDSILSEVDEVEFTGTCTDICVVSNALAFKASFPEISVCVKSDACAGLTPEKHKAALDVMASCQIRVI